MTAAETIREMMAAYDDNRIRWIARNGSPEGFDAWFTAQVERACVERFSSKPRHSGTYKATYTV